MSEMSGMDKYKFRRALEQIEEAAGRGTELVSVYIPPGRPISDVTNYLRAELSQSSNIKSASTRKHVTRAIESAIQRLRSYRMPPANGLVVFTGHKQIGADQTEMVAFVLEVSVEQTGVAGCAQDELREPHGETRLRHETGTEAPGPAASGMEQSRQEGRRDIYNAHINAGHPPEAPHKPRKEEQDEKDP